MSLESAMDEERREVMNLLEGRPPGFGSSRPTPSAPARTASPTPPVRSMLDIGPAAVRHASIAGIGTGVTAGPLQSGAMSSSMLDPFAAPPPRPDHDASTTPPGADTQSASVGHRRANSDVSNTPRGTLRSGSEGSPTLPYARDQFDMASTVSGPSLPVRASQGGRRAGSSMAAVMRGEDLDTVAIGKNHEKHLRESNSSKSPSSRPNRRSDSPGTNRLNTNSFNPMPMPNKFVSDSGKVIDLTNAWRKLSDANIMKSGSSLSTYAAKDPAARARLGSGEMLSPDGELRLATDVYDKDGEDAVESSDEAKSSDEDVARGRRRSRAESSDEEGPKGSAKGAGTRKSAQSLMAAAEEERLSVSSRYKVKSMLEPTVTVTGPGGEKITVKKTGVHPNTNYSSLVSGAGSPASDSEDMGDIRSAQRLHVKQSAIDTSKKHTAIRTIVRGEFSKIQKEGEQGIRRLRNYLVATDLSSEAAYALEWTIGTVLRDGDTVLAVYAIDGGDAIGKPGEADSGLGVGIGEGGKAIQESAVAINKLTETSKSTAPKRFNSPLNAAGAEPRSSRPSSVDARVVPKMGKERLDAIEEITQTCLRFLRKTKLQVRIAIEVIHCKSPKNLITEAVRPSLCGPSALLTEPVDRCRRANSCHSWLTRSKRSQRVRPLPGHCAERI